MSTVKGSNVGEITEENLKNINNLLKAVIKIVLLPQVNTILAQGIPLPTIDDMSLTNTSIDIRDGFLLVTSDIAYSGERYIRALEKELLARYQTSYLRGDAVTK